MAAAPIAVILALISLSASSISMLGDDDRVVTRKRDTTETDLDSNDLKEKLRLIEDSDENVKELYLRAMQFMQNKAKLGKLKNDETIPIADGIKAVYKDGLLVLTMKDYMLVNQEEINKIGQKYFKQSIHDLLDKTDKDYAGDLDAYTKANPPNVKEHLHAVKSFLGDIRPHIRPVESKNHQNTERETQEPLPVEELTESLSTVPSTPVDVNNIASANDFRTLEAAKPVQASPSRSNGLTVGDSFTLTLAVLFGVWILIVTSVWIRREIKSAKERRREYPKWAEPQEEVKEEV